MPVYSIFIKCAFVVGTTLVLISCADKPKQTEQEQSNTLMDAVIFDNDLHSSLVVRTNDAETQVLIRLVRHLEELGALVDEAQYKSNPDSRIHFDYRQLRTDLLSIGHGIRTHLRTPDYSPRTVMPVRGNYRQ